MAIHVILSDPFIADAIVFAVVETIVVSAAERKELVHNEATINHTFSGIVTSSSGCCVAWLCPLGAPCVSRAASWDVARRGDAADTDLGVFVVICSRNLAG